eukprot:CAMPEP_0174840382 /NCGR_PEP_ID=MMETSP1114-20130205/8646_1 /TAXON_ID=312471 /ORGANISM="Neobodo designis, Strain CCAP 1951/1" /LENGTH=533 /DNA_ID=CAMNT_0016074529 /DNA_START=172 /DNA_END=1773 /DNA_ORIENTATION=+
MSDYDEDFESPTKTDASPAASPSKSEAAADDSSSSQQLHVTVVRARNVPASSDVGTLPDPYCAVLVGDQRFQTEACDETTSPEWNATFEFNVADAASDKLTVRLWEDDTFSDDKLGAAVVPLSDDCFVTDEWVEKTVSIGPSGCEIDLKLKAVGFGKAAENKPEEKEAEKEKEEEAAAADTTTNEASPGKESSAPRSPTPSSHRSLTPTPPSSKNSSPAASPTKSDKPADDAEENAENENNNEAAADPAPEQAEHEEREKEKDAAAKASDDDDDDEKKDDEKPADADNTNNDNANNSQSQSKIAQRKRLPPRSGAVATVAYPGERQVAVADILDPTKPLVKSTKPLTRPLGPSFVEETTAEERRQRRLRQKASSTERTQSIAEQRDNERRYLKAQQEFEREKRLAERAIYHRERVSQWATRLGASPLGVDLVADHERIDEEAFVRQREERRRQALAEKRKRRIKNEIIVKALAEVPLLEEARRQKREMLEEERRERAQRDVQRVEAIQARKLRDMALMKAERQSKLDQRLMNA